MPAQPASRFHKTALWQPRINQLPKLVKRKGTRQLSLVWKSTTILGTLCWYSTARVWEWETQNCPYQYCWELLTNEACPCFNWTQSTEGIWTGAQISRVLKSTDVLYSQTCQILHFNATYWPFHYFIFLPWVQAELVGSISYYNFVVGRSSEIRLLGKYMKGFLVAEHN